MGMAPARIPHWEFLGCPDAETFITGIDHYAHPRQCRLRLKELYPMLNVDIPATDDPLPKPGLDRDGHTVGVTDTGHHVVRWADSQTFHWDFGERFHTVEDVFAFSPLAEPDFTHTSIVTNWDFTDEERLYRQFRAQLPAEWGDTAPPGAIEMVGTYQTMFMWPLLTFGWALFMEACLDERFERLMDEFTELNRRLFRAFARLPVHFVTCHDDIVNTRGPVCSPAWMHKYVFPRYEEFWSILKAAGKRVIFISDGCLDTYVPDVFACGASGVLCEPYTNLRAVAEAHENCFIAGEGDTRILARNNPEEITAMVRRMVDTSRITGGYHFRIGNEFTWNTPVEAVKLYLDLCNEWGVRG